MPRTYTVSFESVAVSASQDLVEIKGSTGKTCRILEVAVSATDTTIPTGQMLAIRCRYLPATVTNGSGGSTPTPRLLDPGDAAASFTALANNTTPATSSGTPVILREDGFHIFNGYSYPFPRPPVIGLNEAFTFELLSTVTGTVHLSGCVTVEETGA